MYHSEFGRRLRSQSGGGVGTVSSSSSVSPFTAANTTTTAAATASHSRGPSAFADAAATLANLSSSPSRLASPWSSSAGRAPPRAGSAGPPISSSPKRPPAAPPSFASPWANASAPSLLQADGLGIGTSSSAYTDDALLLPSGSPVRRRTSPALSRQGSNVSMTDLTVGGASGPPSTSVAAGSSRRNTPGERPRTPGKKPRPSSTMIADRYIPTRDGSDIQSVYQLMHDEPTTPSQQKRRVTADMDAHKEEANAAFSTLLSSELFGPDAVVPGSSSRSGATSGVGTSTSSSMHSSGGGSGRHATSSLGGIPASPATPTKKSLFSYGGSRSPASSPARSPRTPKGGGRSSGGGGSSVAGSGSGGMGEHRLTARGAGLFGGLASVASNSGAGVGAGLGGVVKTLDSPHHSAYSLSPMRHESQRMLLSPRKTPRTLSKVPFKVLDAPDLADDFYLNLVDWSSRNVMGVGLGQCVYLWSAKDSEVTKLCDLSASGDRITGLSWAGRGHHLAVGTNKGLVQIWDAESVKLIRTMSGHDMRVGSLAWNEHILTSGSRDRRIFHRDVRAPEHWLRELKGHRQEVCGLKWNTSSNQLASGGNDNKLLVWDGLYASPLHRFTEHTAAVKAIAWSPHQQGLLASGGGTQDMKIRFWNTNVAGSLLHEVDTASQVCNLLWSRSSNELVSTHGFSSGKVQNQIHVWRYPSMQQLATLTGHTMRVLYLAASPDGETIVTGAGDETLRFWDLNTPAKSLADRRVAAQAAAQAGGSYSAELLNPFAKLR